MNMLFTAIAAALIGMLAHLLVVDGFGAPFWAGWIIAVPIGFVVGIVGAMLSK